MPSGKGAKTWSQPIPASDTPALAKPNSGTIRNALHGDIACSSRCSGESAASGEVGVITIGIVIAASTPAIVACTPDISTAYHSRPDPIR